jgi:hypothetical protein
MSDKDKPIAELQKSAKEVIRFRLGEFKGFNYVDIRSFSVDENGTFPTKKGITIPPRLWPQFKAALVEVERALVNQRLLDPEDLDQDIPF